MDHNKSPTCGFFSTNMSFLISNIHQLHFYLGMWSNLIIRVADIFFDKIISLPKLRKNTFVYVFKQYCIIVHRQPEGYAPMGP